MTLLFEEIHREIDMPMMALVRHQAITWDRASLTTHVGHSDQVAASFYENHLLVRAYKA